MKLYYWFVILALPYLSFADFKVVNQTNKIVSIEFQIENLTESQLSINGYGYTLFQFDGAVFPQREGLPAIPQVQTRLAVPIGAKIRSQVINVESETRLNTDILPQYINDLRNKNHEIPRDESIYHSSVPFPEDQLEIGEPYNYRGVNVVSLRINPIQYYPANHQVVIHKKMRITFEFIGGKPLSTPAKISKYENDILIRKIVNHQQVALFRYPESPKLFKTTVNYDLSIGTWFRIPIKEEGIYQVTSALLNSAGVNIDNIQINNIHLYNYGGFALPYDTRRPRPNDLNEIAVEVIDADQDGIMDDNDRVIFYGKGLGGWQFANGSWFYHGNPDGSGTLFPYDDTNYYLMTFDDKAGKRIESVQSPQLQNPQVPSRFTDYYHFEEDQYNILSSGLDWYWLKMSGTSDKRTATFNLPQNFINDSIEVVFRFHGGSRSFFGSTGNFTYNLKGLVNSQIVFDNLIFSNYATVVKKIPLTSLSSLIGGNNVLEIQHIGNDEGCEVYLDFLEVMVHRPFVAENNYIHFRDVLPGNTTKEYRIVGLPSENNTIWDISDITNVKKVEPLQNGETIVFQDSTRNTRHVDYYVFSSGAIRNIEGMQVLDNHPNLRDPFRKAEFIIITPDEFYDAIEFLEVARETQIPNRLETERVKLSEIFLEFSSSVKDVTAIRDFIHYVYENWSDTLKYVLLFGDGHYDYRNIRLPDIPNLIPPFEITNKPNQTPEVDSRETDNYYVALGMTGNLGEIDPFLSIARLPINSAEQIEIYRDKIDKYSKSYTVDPEKNGWQSWLTFVSDDETGESGNTHELVWHLEPTIKIVNSYIPEKFNLTKIYLHDYEPIPGGLGRWKPKATEDLINQINRGTLLINFFGHGDPDTWAHESVLNRTRDLPKFQNDYRLPLWVAATCTWGKYDNPNRPSMSEELIWRSKQGGIAVISASRPVFVSGNKALADSFYKNLFNSRSNNLPSRLLGDAFFMASGWTDNFQKYHLYSDPTLHLADSQYLIKIESIEPDTLKALSTVQVNAKITDRLGTALTEFNGFAVINAFDAVDKKFVEEGSKRYDYVYNGGTIFKGLVSVKDGELTGRFIVPKSIKYDSSYTGRLSIYAWSEVSGDAVGFSDNLLFYGSDQQVDDKTGPEIKVSFKDLPNFFDGDFVGSQPTVFIELTDDNGINLTGEVGHRIEIVINENIKKDVTEFFVYDTDSYKNGKLEYTLPALTSGSHQLKITCWDNLNNSSEHFVNFRTVTADELMITEVVNFPNPFSDRTHFTFQLISPVGSADVTIGIYTVTGRKIYEMNDFAVQGFNKIPAAGWDGRDWDGDIIANGVYLYKIVVDDGESRVEKIEKLAVVR